MSDYVPIHMHDEYSLLDGLFSPSSWIDRVEEIGADSFAITNHGNVASVLQSFVKAKERGIKSIPGVEAYWTRDLHSRKIRSANHVVLLASNNEGWENLIKLNRIAWTDGFYYSPRLDLSAIQQHKEGLIVSSACIKGPVGAALLGKKGSVDRAVQACRRWNEAFEGNFYLELMLNGMEEQRALNKVLLALSDIFRIPCIITLDSHYPWKGGHELQKLIIKITHTDFEFTIDDLWLKSYDELVRSWKKHHSDYMSEKQFKCAMNNTLEVASRCNADIPVGKHRLPKFPIKTHAKYKEGYTTEDLFYRLLRIGWKKRLGTPFPDLDKPDGEYEKRLVYEYGILRDAKFLDYFLIVKDIIDWSRRMGVEVGGGRGSVAGSLIAWLLDITEVDPIRHKLLFERFLNPARISGERAKSADSLPDIDMDFQAEARDAIKGYIRDKYGADRVCTIGSYGRMHLKGCIKDLARSCEYKLLSEKPNVTYIEINNITSKLPDKYEGKPLTTIEEACEASDDFAEFYEKHQEWFEKYVRPAIGQARHLAAHPAGIIVAPKSLDKYVPIRTQKEGKSGERILVSQWEDKWIERRGLLKLDVLGLTQLSIIRRMREHVRERHEEEIDLPTIPLDDEATLAKFAEGETAGVFQFNCLAPNTMIRRPNGAVIQLIHLQHKWKRRFDLGKKTKIISYDVGENKLHCHTIKRVVYAGRREVYRLVYKHPTRARRSIDTSLRHRLLIVRDRGTMKERTLWAELAYIKVGKDKVLCSYGHRIYHCKVLAIKSVLDARGEHATTPMFDIEMDGEPRSFIANGLISHNSALQSEYCSRLKPNTFEDLVAVNALLRPGPMGVGAHDRYIDLKNGVKKPKYEHKLLIPITQSTYGECVFQEQIMKIASALGGLSLAEADIWRTAIKKKDESQMGQFRKRFLKGAVANGMEKVRAKKLWRKLLKFSFYCFNLSHSCSYAMLGFWAQYLKVKYPLEFWASTMEFSPTDKKAHDNIYDLGKRARSFGIKFRLPNVNDSGAIHDEFTGDTRGTFTIVDDRIVLPLTIVKGIGHKAAMEIVKAAPFESFKDFMTRINKRVLNKRVMVALIAAGAFKCFGLKPGDVMKEYFLSRGESIPDEFVGMDKDNWRLKRDEMLGFGAANIKEMFAGKLNKKVMSWEEYRKAKNDMDVFIAGRLTRIKQIKDKKGNRMAFLQIDDADEGYEIVAWGGFWEKYLERVAEKEKKRPVQGGIVEVYGRKGKGRRGDTQIFLDDEEGAFFNVVA